MLDIMLLQVVKHKKDYLEIVPGLPDKSLDPKTKALLDDFGKYFEKFSDHDKLDMATFMPRFKQWHPSMTEEMFSTYVGIMKQVDKDVTDATRVALMTDLQELSLATRVANLAAQFDNGELEFPFADYVKAAVDSYNMALGIRDVPWCETPIEDLLQEDLDDTGVRWRLNCLNECMRGLRPGDFGVIAGRPDKGKTTFISSEITYMASQLPKDKNILWLNNEGMASRIKKRVYQSALGMTVSELVDLSQRGKLSGMYDKAVGRIDRIRVVDCHGWHVGQVEAAIERTNAGIVVMDMIDNIRGFGNEARTDLALEKMYQWARERAVKYECIVLATSQISSEGDGLMYPTLPMLKDSKTGKQGASDFQLMIGASNDANLRYSRYLGLPKNKLRREGKPSDPQCEVTFKPDTARYVDTQISA